MTTAREITLALRGRWYGRYGLAFCPAHANSRTPALRLRDGAEGRLLAVCGAGCDFREVLGALRDRGLLDGSGGFDVDPTAEAQRRAKEAAERQKRVGQARAIWSESVAIEGTLAEAYLRERAIRGPLPSALRFHPAAWHKGTARRLPAMVAAVELEGHGLVAVHRTYLAEPGRKAAVDPAKAMLGPTAGGAVRLREGTGPLVVAEGIETALSLADDLVDEDPAVWAALSTSGVSGVVLPWRPTRLAVAPDGDPPGWKAATTLADRAHAMGWRVRLIPAPGPNLDWNDAARRRAEVAS